MKKEWLIDRQGKTFVLYGGLLDEAHQAGLKAIRTRLIQAPCAENNDTTIVVAEVEMGDGRVFSGIGDANPSNVGRNIIPAAIRMAETRAKARALRDAINVGTVALEELDGDEDEPPAYQPRQQRPTPTPIRQQPRTVAGGAPTQAAIRAQTPADPDDELPDYPGDANADLKAEGGLATNQQNAALLSHGKALGMDPAQLDAWVMNNHGQGLTGISKQEAAKAIDGLLWQRVLKAQQALASVGVQIDLPPKHIDLNVWLADAEQTYRKAKAGAK